MIPKWYQLAMEELGTTEGKGSADNPRVIEYHAATGLKASHDVVPWCGAFMAWLMLKSGIKYRESTAARARDWLEWGVELKTPIIGAVGVIPRGKDGSGQGHVFIFAGWKDESEGTFKMLGGNQGGGSRSGHDGAVTLSVGNAHEVLGWRWPKEVPIPVAQQPYRKSSVIQGGTILGGIGVGTVVTTATDIGKAITTATQGVNIPEKVQENVPVLVEAVKQSEEIRANGTIIGAVVGVLIIAVALWVILSRINGARKERKFSAE